MAGLRGFILFTSSLLVYVGGYEINTDGQVLSLMPGENVELPCVVVGDDFDPYRHTLKWIKTQAVADPNGVEVSSFANVDKIFVDAGRYSVVREVVGNSESFTLSITGVQNIDSGKYRCQILESGKVTESVEHTLKIYDPVESLALAGFNSSTLVPDNFENTVIGSTPDSLSFSEDVAGYFECRVIGGYPGPSIRLLLDDTQITGSETIESKVTSTLVGDTPGLQKITYTSRAIDNNFKPTAESDGRQLKCRSEVRLGDEVKDRQEVSTSLDVRGAPVFKNCTKEARYPLGTKGASLYCDIFSKPEYTGIKWQGITVEVEVTNSVDGSASDEIQTFTRLLSGDHLYRTTLLFPALQSSHFQMYKLTVTNSLGSRETTVKLIKGTNPQDDTIRSSACTPTAAPIISLLSLIILILVH